MVYLICFARPYPRGSRGTIRHYIGFTRSAETLPRRVEHHRNGTGSRLLAAVAHAGIGFDVVRTWPDGDRTHERRLKKQKHAPRLCPVCSPRKAA